MLLSLNIKNLVLIHELNITFEKGLCVFTGETGAGKSTIFEALGLALGMRGELGLIRQEQDQALVTAHFHFPSQHPVYETLKQHNISCQKDNIITLTRQLSRQTGSRAWINKQSVTIQCLKTIGNLLGEIHYQSRHSPLMDPCQHLYFLDRYAKTHQEKEACQRAYEKWQNKRQILDQALHEQETLEERKEFLSQALSELDEIEPIENEENQCLEKRSLMVNQEKIHRSVSQALEHICHPTSCEQAMNQALNSLEKVNDTHQETITQIIQTLERSQIEINEATCQLQSLQDQLGHYDQEKLECIEDRLSQLRFVAKKHKISPNDLAHFRKKTQEEYDQLIFSQQHIPQMKEKAEKAHKNYLSCAQKLSQIRQEAGEKLSQEINSELPHLNLKSSHFKVEQKEKQPQNHNGEGMDDIIFTLATNFNQQLQPLNKIASGGELSRLLLAMYMAVSQRTHQKMFIFDEIDTGMSGSAAEKVAQRLKRLSNNTQVFVITHCAHVAAYGHAQYNVYKLSHEKTTQSYIKHVTGPSRLKAIAHMISGEHISSQATALAQQLLNQTRHF